MWYKNSRPTAPWKVISNAFRLLYPFDIFIRFGNVASFCLNCQRIWEMFSKVLSKAHVLDCECYQMHSSLTCSFVQEDFTIVQC